MQIPEILTTERLTIRKFRPEDKPMFIDFMTDKETTKYLEFSATQKSPQGATHLLDFILESYKTDEPVFSLAIENQNNGYIGSCGVSKIDDEAWE